ncbi:MAG UNVERIFIED_CONTAM: hypothetical protein LVR29_11105 [Microcystis novacekii LVE1205-3]
MSDVLPYWISTSAHAAVTAMPRTNERCQPLPNLLSLSLTDYTLDNSVK